MNEEKLTYADFLPDYPSQFVENIQSELYNLYEFRSLASSLDEPAPTRGKFYKHQLLNMRFFREFDRGILIHRTGTGKTSALQAFTEWARKEHISNPLFEYRRAYIILPGSIVGTEFRTQLFCKTDTGEFENLPEVVNAKTEQGREHALTRRLSTFYEIVHYGQFANVLRDKTDAQIKREYSNCIFFLDEIHKANIDFETYKVQIVEGNYTPPPAYVKGDVKAKGQPKKIYTYYMLKRLFENAEGIKVIGATATPMSNSIDEIVPLVNLVTYKERRMPVQLRVGETLISYEDLFLASTKEARANGKDDVTDLATQVLEPYFRGLFSYVREADVNVKQSLVTNQKQDYGKPFYIYNPYIIKNNPVYNVNLSFEQNMKANIELDPKNVINNPYQMVKSGSNFVLTKAAVEEPALIQIENGVGITTIKNIDVTPEISDVLADPLNLQPDATYEQKFFGVPITDPIHQEIYDTARVAEENTKSSAFGVREQQAGAYYFPDGGYDSNSFDKFYVWDGNSKKFSLRDWGVPTNKESSDLNLLKPGTPNYFVMFFHMLRLLRDGAKVPLAAKHFNDADGVAILYTEFLRNAVGAPVIGSILETLFGYELYTGQQSAFTSGFSGIEDKLPPLCASIQKEINLTSFPEKKRYAIISGKSDTSSAQIRHILELLNSPQNWDGRFLKGIIFTQAAEVGVSFSHVIQISVVTGQFQPSEFYQLISRAIRATSHEEVRRQRARKGNIADIIIPVYRYIVYIPDELLESAENRKLVISVEKNFWIKRMERVLKRCSFDCIIHKARNTRPPQYNGSELCDFGNCDYKCFSSASGNEASMKNYNILYLDEVVDPIFEEIKRVLLTRISVQLDTLYKLIHRPPIHIDYAIEKIIREKRRFFDRYGRVSFLQVSGNLCYLSKNYPVGRLISSTPDELVYTQYMFFSRTTEFDDFLNKTSDIETILKSSWTPANLANVIAHLNHREKVSLLETTILLLIQVGGKAFQDALYQMYLILNTNRGVNIITAFDYTIARLPLDPVQLLILRLYAKGYWIVELDRPKVVELVASISRSKQNKQRGKKKLQPDLPIHFIDLVPVPPDNRIELQGTPVIVHRVYNMLNLKNTQYNVGSNYRKVKYHIPQKNKEFNPERNILRILKFSDAKLEWNDLRTVEWAVYAALYNYRLAQEFLPLELSSNFFGTILDDGEFRIRIKGEDENQPTKKNKEKNDRKVRNGKKCHEIEDLELIKISFELQLPPPGFNTWAEVADAIRRNYAEIANLPNKTQVLLQLISQYTNVSERMSVLLEEFTEEMMVYALIWVRSITSKKPQFCPILERILREKNLLYDVELYINLKTKEEEC